MYDLLSLYTCNKSFNETRGVDEINYELISTTPYVQWADLFRTENLHILALFTNALTVNCDGLFSQCRTFG